MSHARSTTRSTVAQERSARMDDATREAQARLADKSFTTFMRAHNSLLGESRTGYRPKGH
jgi:hypothetical protein